MEIRIIIKRIKACETRRDLADQIGYVLANIGKTTIADSMDAKGILSRHGFSYVSDEFSYLPPRPIGFGLASWPGDCEDVRKVLYDTITAAAVRIRASEGVESAIPLGAADPWQGMLMVQQWCDVAPGEADTDEEEELDVEHSEDFTTVTWYGEKFTFNTTQAQCVALLWAEWKKDPKSNMALHQRTIRDWIQSSNANFRLSHVFRVNGKAHPAWGRMIHGNDQASFYLGKPPRKKAERRKKAKK